MQRWRVSRRPARMFAALAFGVIALIVSTLPTSAQTTATLSDPTSEVVYATIRGGSYADSNLRTLLVTRASSNPEYHRRALLKFDTHNGIPAGSTISSALLTITVKLGSEDKTRSIAAYQITTSWNEKEVTWRKRRTSASWMTLGGDLGSKLDQKIVGNARGTKVTFNVTSLVKQAVAGQLGDSRYTRVALVDLDGSTSESYREYYTPNDPNASVRPVLKVTYHHGSTSTAVPAPASSTSSSSSSSASSSTLRVLQWNTHHGGVGTDGEQDAERLVRKAASFKPDIVSFNEVERYTSWANNDGPAVVAALMKQYTGQKWYYKFSTATGDATGNGNLVMSRFPFDSTAVRMLSHDRSAVDVVIHVHGRDIHFTSTHLDPDSTGFRLAEIGELIAWERTLAEPRIVAGDFNAWPGSSENAKMKSSYYDSWAEADADGHAVAYNGNPNGNTRKSRIDYIYYSRGATALTLKSSQVYDVRDSKGVMPSDHRPVLTVFGIK
jgi:endonuclease/exonuclease/phosphatase family metal-dependent hydrolase